jgi:hypothetical protein
MAPICQSMMQNGPGMRRYAIVRFGADRDY